jgi:predicted Zn-dependent peptidase
VQNSFVPVGLALALAFGALPAAADPPTPSQPAPATTAGAAFTVPVFHDKLPNGLHVVVSEDHAAPIVTVEVMYKVGFRIEPKDRTGFAHLFEHMMFQGSNNVGKMEHVKMVQTNGGVLNGSTRFDYTNYFETIPSNALELMLWLEADRMRSLNVTQENLSNQQNVVSEEVRVNVLNQPYGMFEILNLWQRAHTNWYNAHNFYGDLSHLEAATLVDVKTFFDTYYAPNNAVLVVVGDTTPAEVMKLAGRYFGSISSHDVPPLPDMTEPRQTEEKRSSEDDKLARTPAIALGYHLPTRLSKEFFALAVLDPLLVGDESSRLYQALVKQKKIATAVAGGFNYGLGNYFDYLDPMLYTIRVDYLADRKGAEVLAAVDEVLGEIAANGVSAEDLARAKTGFKAWFYGEMAGGGFPGFGKANMLAAFMLFEGDPNRINSILGEVEKVTAADVQAAAREYLRATNRTSIDRVPAAGATAGGVQ